MLLTTAIEKGDLVEIFVREIGNAERTSWENLPVSLLLGVEAAFIEDLNPAWNRRGRKSIEDQ